MDYSTKKVNELKQLCKDKSLPTSGTKNILIQRLQDFDIETNKFKVFVKTLMGSIYTIHIEKDETIYELKQKIYDKLGYDIDKQMLYYICSDKSKIGDMTYPNGQIGKKTENDKTLSDYNVSSESTFNLHVKLI